ncbi:MAG: enoyl-CoA hydratase/isomerase family protein [Syntrophales bacterium]|jgi:enoyl-CoA hydratase/carnithine racemase
MIYRSILLEKLSGYAIITMNCPSEMNALSMNMREELTECFGELENDSQVRSIILTGGDYVFSAGMDINEMAALNDDEVEKYIKSIVSYLKKIYTFPKPVIAAVGGIALGGGFNLATVCDLIIASESAIFGHPEVKFGLNPLFKPLSRVVGPVKAKEITMFGEPIGAQEAWRIGLVNKVTSPERLMEEAILMAEELARRSSKVIEAIKKVSQIVPWLDDRVALDLEFDISALLFSRDERKAYMSEFLDSLKKRSKKS